MAQRQNDFGVPAPASRVGSPGAELFSGHNIFHFRTFWPSARALKANAGGLLRNKNGQLYFPAMPNGGPAEVESVRVHQHQILTPYPGEVTEGFGAKIVKKSASPSDAGQLISTLKAGEVPTSQARSSRGRGLVLERSEIRSGLEDFSP